MNDIRDDSNSTKEGLLNHAKILATPIDFDRLINDGILKKKGAWYEILDMERLPEHAKNRISAVLFDGRRKVRFSKTRKSVQDAVNEFSNKRHL